MRTYLIGFILTALLIPSGVSAQQAEPFSATTFKAEVVYVESFGERSIAETRLKESYQQLEVRLLEGARAGATVSVENTTPVTFAIGDTLYVHRTSTNEGELWSAGEPERTDVLTWLALTFVVVTVVIGGRAGARALLSLGVSFLIIIFGLIPALYAGAPPVLTSIGVTFAMLVVSMLLTHGVNRPTIVALIGSTVALAVGAGISELAVTLAQLSGFASDESVYLNFATDGALNLSALVLGSILIGIVGVLNDISVSQVHTVAELHEANPSLSRARIRAQALKVGREHLGAVVNTLPLAYAGAALPLLLLFSTASAPFLYIVNREVFATEIIRILAGGIALSLSGAIATLLAVWLLVPSKKPA